jgi:hypothetical protein
MRAYDPTTSPYEPYWISADRTEHPLYSMETRHIQNILNQYKNGCFGAHT